jgi:uncharacterized membrane protein
MAVPKNTANKLAATAHELLASMLCKAMDCLEWFQERTWAMLLVGPVAVVLSPLLVLLFILADGLLTVLRLCAGAEPDEQTPTSITALLWVLGIAAIIGIVVALSSATTSRSDDDYDGPAAEDRGEAFGKYRDL